MSLDSLSVIQYIPSKYALDLEWSLGPLFFCLKVFGVPIGQSTWSSSLRRKLVVGGGAILVIWIALSQLYIFFFNFNMNFYLSCLIRSSSKITGPVTGLFIATNTKPPVSYYLIHKSIFFTCSNCLKCRMVPIK